MRTRFALAVLSYGGTLADIQARIDALVAAGMNPVDAELVVSQVDRDMPSNADPATWVYEAPQMMEMAVVSVADVESALEDWFAADYVPDRYKRVLTATTEMGGE